MILLLEDDGAKGSGAMSEKWKALPTFANMKGEIQGLTFWRAFYAGEAI